MRPFPDKARSRFDLRTIPLAGLELAHWLGIEPI